MSFEQIAEKLRDRRLNLSEVSRKAGLSRFTLHKIVNGTQKSIKIENLIRLQTYFQEN